MSGLVDWALARTRMMLTLIALAVLAGVSAYFALPRQGAPEIDIPNLYVSVPVEGASASDVERLVLKPLETELRDIKSLKNLDTFASEGHGGALLEFDQNWDKSARLADLRDRVERARAEMPDSAEEPRIIEINLQEMPILVVAVSGPAPERARLRAAKALQRELESLGSVLEAELTGARDEVLEAVLDPAKLETLGVSPEQLLELVRANNRLVAAGALSQGSASASVRLPGSFEEPRDAADLPVIVDGDRIVRLGQLGEIRRTFKEAEGAARFNGEPTMALQVKKRAEANIIETVDEVKKTALALRDGWPAPLREAIKIGFVLDMSQEVEDMAGQLEASVMTAVLLVMVVVLAALGLRSALLVGFAVPASFLLAFALFAVLGFPVDNMVMFGLILSVGMLVDGAIVVAELSERYLGEGMTPREAYAASARRMFWPIVSSTATTLAAFLPMLFWPGMAGEFMRLLPITLIFVLSASLATALIFLPVIGATTGAIAARVGRLFMRRPAPNTEPAASEQTATPTRGGLLAAAPRLYSRGIRSVIASPLAVILALALTVGAVFSAFALYQTHDKGTEFFVETEPVRAMLYVRALGNFSPSEKDRLVRGVEDKVREVDGVGAVFAFSGGGGLQIFGAESPEDSIGQLQIELEPWQTRFARDRKGKAVMADIRAAVQDAPGLIPELREMKDSPSQGKPVQLRILSTDQARLEAATERMRALFESTEGLKDVDDTRPLPGLQWRLEVDRAAAGRFGADIGRVGALVQLATRGVILDEMTPEDSDEAIDVIARFGEQSRTLDGLDALRIATAEGVAPLSNFVTRTAEPAAGAISRRDGQRFYMVRADAHAGVNVNDTIAVLEKSIEQIRAENPAALAGVKIEFAGEQEEQAKTAAFLGGAMLAALGLIFVILLAQFDSFYNAILVLSAVAMSVGGVLVGIMVMDQTFSIIMTGTGVVALAGIVVNNNIVLIDTYQEFSRRMGPLEAIARTAEQRLRPVLLTTLTTMAGLAPMMFAASIDFSNLTISVGAPTALWWIQLATAVVFGLGFATLLTLLATPAALAARIWAGAWMAYGFERLAGGEGGRARARRALDRRALWRGPSDRPAFTGGPGPHSPRSLAAE